MINRQHAHRTQTMHMEDIDRQWTHETTGAAGRQETHEQTRAGRQENLMKHQEQADITNRKKPTACMQEIWNINIIQQVCTQENMNPSTAVRQDMCEQSAKCTKDMYDKTKTHRQEKYETHEQQADMNHMNKSAAGRHDKYESTSSMQTWTNRKMNCWHTGTYDNTHSSQTEEIWKGQTWQTGSSTANRQHSMETKQQPDRTNMKTTKSRNTLTTWQNHRLSESKTRNTSSRHTEQILNNTADGNEHWRKANNRSIWNIWIINSMKE